MPGPLDAFLYGDRGVYRPGETVHLNALLRDREVKVENHTSDHYTVLDVHTRVSDLYSSPHDQIKEQLRLVIETIKEKLVPVIQIKEVEKVVNTVTPLIKEVEKIIERSMETNETSMNRYSSARL